MVAPHPKSNQPVPPRSVITFDRSQQRFFEDQSRIQVANFHRQKGKDFTAAGKAVDGALKTGDSWFIVSLTQRQADETFRKAKGFFEAVKQVARIAGEAKFSEHDFQEYDKWLDQSFKFTARELILPNGGRVVSLPGRDPDTIAGYTGNVILTEFALFPNGGFEHWSVIFPIINRSGRYKLIVISTPRGKNTKFYELCNDENASQHFCDIYQSVHEEGYQLFDKEGNPYPQNTKAERDAAIEAFRAMYGDESKWPREYGCQHTGDLESLLKFAQIEAACLRGQGLPFDWHRIDNDSMGSWLPEKFFTGFTDEQNSARFRFELGWDVARTSDISALWCNMARPAGEPHLRHLVLMHKTSFALQRRIVRAAMKQCRRNVGCGDATGLGMDSNETFLNEFGERRWEPVTFTQKSKAELASIALDHFENASQSLPDQYGDAAFIATDLQAVQCDRSSGNVKLDESPNPHLPESHCDIAYANFLALKARQLKASIAGASWL